MFILQANIAYICLFCFALNASFNVYRKCCVSQEFQCLSIGTFNWFRYVNWS